MRQDRLGDGPVGVGRGRSVHAKSRRARDTSPALSLAQACSRLRSSNASASCVAAPTLRRCEVARRAIRSGLIRFGLSGSAYSFPRIGRSFIMRVSAWVTPCAYAASIFELPAA